MKFTGERFIPSEQGKIYLEHYHRYAVVKALVQNKEVLDVASGEGYGSAILASSAKSVIGVDISDEAVEHASLKYQYNNLRYFQGSATALNFPDESFDAVISFETIEHLLEQEEVISEIHRVLRPNGILVISSPNRPIYAEENSELNEFHLKELDFDELDLLLKSKFKDIQYYGQRLKIGSVIEPISFDKDLHAYQAWLDQGGEINSAVPTSSDPVYFLAVCSKKNGHQASLDASIFFPPSVDLLQQYIGYAKWAKQVDLFLLERDEQIRERDEQIRERDEQIKGGVDRILLLEKSLSATNLEVLKLKNTFINRVIRFFGRVAPSYISVSHLSVAPEVATAFDSEFYLRSYPDVAASGMNPLTHYMKFGAKEGRFPNSEFDSGYYLRSYPDVAASGMNPLEHYMLFGKSEGRPCNSAKIYRNFTAEILKTGFKKPISKQDHVARASELAFHVEGVPLVSIVIPVYGQCDYTLQCLYSILLNKPQNSFEIILVDDCSPDFSEEILSEIRGVTYLKNTENLGFIRSCNAGAKLAKGRFLCFLNNDTFVLPAWLDELVATFDTLPGTGLVGSKLLYPNGRLQEAGGIIWKDGRAWNLGRDGDPSLPEFNYVREVDYCSGASIMIEKKLFDSINGFDEEYLPAYCEDSDLALKVRSLGYRVLYQPFSEVVHFEGVTSGTDDSSGAKSYQRINKEKLFARWKDRLMSHGESGKHPEKERDRNASARVLVLEVITPTPDCDAGSVTDINLIILLREMGFKVTFIAVDNFHYDQYVVALQKMGVEVLYRPYQTSVHEHLVEFGSSYDLVFLFRPQVAENNLEMVKGYCVNSKTLYYPHDLHHLRMQREINLLGDKSLEVQCSKIKTAELAAIKGVDLAIMVSNDELEIIQAEAPSANLKTFPLILDTPGTSVGFDERKDIIFIGGFNHKPNIDAINYFVIEVMPTVRQLLPGVVLHIVGSNPTDEVIGLGRDDIVVHGFVKDLNSLLEKMKVSIVPLRYGAGVKGKVGTSMAAGLPVVTTAIGAEGMNLQHKINAMIADSPEEFADAIAGVYLNPDLWKSLSINGIDFAERSWGANAAWDSFSAILKSLGFDVPARPNKLQLYKQ
jgi:GT2 family glycosyltransferase/SAM-dependent methyltransferase